MNKESRIMRNSSFIIPDSNKIGPFTDGRAIKTVLRLLRRHFPYCTCKNPHLRTCLNAQIGNCPSYCCALTHNRQLTTDNKLIKQYRKNIAKIKNILTGKDKKFIRQLKDPYELLVLEKIWEHEPYLNKGMGLRVKGLEKNLKNLSSKSYPLNPSRVECYDNSHLSGKEAVGAMTAWRRLTANNQQPITWVADKNMWRKFKHANSTRFAEATRNANAPIRIEDDGAMMYDMISRRLNHPEWPYPDLIIIDGGITQLNATKRALHARIMNNELRIKDKPIIHTSKFIIPKIISFAKPQQLVFGIKKRPIPISQLPADFQKLITMAIQNTHNFVIRYHRSLREKI